MKLNQRIYLSSPHMGGEELKYIKEAFDTNWIAPLGKNVDEFEKDVANYVGKKYAAATVSGTSAIHLALKWVGIEQGDYVFCSAFTFAGSCNAILYEKAKAVFIDSEPESYNMSPIALEKAFLWAVQNNKMPKAVIIVNLYGASADYDKLLPICKKYNVPVIEDAAESLGGTYKGQKSGSFGDLSIISFNGNKIITTSGGGMLLSNDEKTIKKARFWSTQSRDNAPYYQHSEVGYNYRMSNISAGIGRGQMTVLDKRVQQKIQINKKYKEAFANSPLEIIQAPEGTSTYWLTIARLHTNNISYMEIINSLNESNIEARPVWKPMHMQPVYKNSEYFTHKDKTSVSDEIFAKGLCLPSDTKMTDEQQGRVIEVINKILRKA